MRHHNCSVTTCTSIIVVLVILSCSESVDNETPEFEITEVLYDGDDIARVSFDSNTNEYLLFFHRKDDEGRKIDEGPFIYKVMNRDFEEIRTGEFGSANNSTNDLWYRIEILPLPDTVLGGRHKILRDGTIMRVSHNLVDLLDEEYNILNSIKLPYAYGDHTETDNLIAFTFSFSIPPSEESVICVTYNKTTQETRNYVYQLDSEIEEAMDWDFEITHNPNQELIMRTPNGIYKLVADKWERILKDHFYSGRRSTSLLVDSRNRLHTIVAHYAEIYDLNTEIFVTQFDAPREIVGEHPDGDIIIFRHPFFSNRYDHKLFKMKIY